MIARFNFGISRNHIFYDLRMHESGSPFRTAQ
jgi:hypothetical protein